MMERGQKDVISRLPQDQVDPYQRAFFQIERPAGFPVDLRLEFFLASVRGIVDPEVNVLMRVDELDGLAAPDAVGGAEGGVAVD